MLQLGSELPRNPAQVNRIRVGFGESERTILTGCATKPTPRLALPFARVSCRPFPTSPGANLLRNFSAILLLSALVATIVPPGYAAYIGSYATILLSFVAIAVFSSRERDVLVTPPALAIYGAIVLVSLTLPLVYQGSQDLLAPIMLLPMLSAVALATLARPAGFVPDGTIFASICLFAAAIAAAGGIYEHYVLGVARPGLGNNAIHYASLAVMAGGMALVGVASGLSPWRYLFLFGPTLGLSAATVSGSRGAMVGAAAMAAAAVPFVMHWLWQERLFRIAALSAFGLSAATLALLVGSGNQRVMGIFTSAFDIFQFTGSIDDIRAGLYSSAIRAFIESPVYGHGLGQLMQTTRETYSDQAIMHQLGDLHADWANFAVMAGTFGLVAYILLLAAPLLLLLDPKARGDRSIVLGVALLVTGQLILGISNATFGILPQTMIYAVMLAYLMIRTRRNDQIAKKENPS